MKACFFKLQVNILAVEYPGYGLCGGGQANPDSVTANARLGLRFLKEVLGFDSDEIIILGRSIGCGPAMVVATEEPTYGLILVCPFLSVKELAKIHVGPLAQFVDERFPNEDLISRLTSRLLLIHGKVDRIVPFWHGEASTNINI